MVVPTAYVAAALFRRQGFSFNRFLRATWLGGLAGAASGAGYTYASSLRASPQQLRERRIFLAYDVNTPTPAFVLIVQLTLTVLGAIED